MRQLCGVMALIPLVCHLDPSEKSWHAAFPKKSGIARSRLPFMFDGMYHVVERALFEITFGRPRRQDASDAVPGARRGRGNAAEHAETAGDDALVAHIRAGDPHAFDGFVVEHLTAAVGFAASFTQANDVAEDIVQDALAAMWRGKERLPRQTTLRAYLFAAIRNRALDWIKHQRVAQRAIPLLQFDYAMPTSNDVDDEETQQRLALIRETLATLPERQRTAITLRYARSLKVSEIANILGVSVKATEQLLVRGIRTLRQAAQRARESRA